MADYVTTRMSCGLYGRYIREAAGLERAFDTQTYSACELEFLLDNGINPPSNGWHEVPRKYLARLSGPQVARPEKLLRIPAVMESKEFMEFVGFDRESVDRMWETHIDYVNGRNKMTDGSQYPGFIDFVMYGIAERDLGRHTNVSSVREAVCRFAKGLDFYVDLSQYKDDQDMPRWFAVEARVRWSFVLQAGNILRSHMCAAQDENMANRAMQDVDHRAMREDSPEHRGWDDELSELEFADSDEEEEEEEEDDEDLAAWPKYAV